MPPVKGPFPPPPVHPKTHHRLLGVWLPDKESMSPPRNRHNRGAKDDPRLHRVQACIETALTAGWNCLTVHLTGHMRGPALPMKVTPPLIFEVSRRASRATYSRLASVCGTWSPLAIMSVAKPPAILYTRTRYVWRIRETLPLSDAPDLLALSSPDPRALGDPRLHCWLIPPVLPEEDLPAWREVLEARPEVPVLFEGAWEMWGRTLHNRLRLLSALGESQALPVPPRNLGGLERVRPLTKITLFGG